jgi:hypothetical protein
LLKLAKKTEKFPGLLSREFVFISPKSKSLLYKFVPKRFPFSSK